MTTVYYTCSFVPLELITACGCVPQRLLPALGDSNTSQAEGMCAFTEAWLEILLNKAKQNEDFIAVFSTSCDQMRRAFDLYRQHSKQPSFLLNVPSTATEHSLNYYRQELERLKMFLCSVSGQSFDQRLFSKNTPQAEQIHSSKKKYRLRIAVVGGPTPASARNALNELIEASNAGILLDATEDRLIDHFKISNQAKTQQDTLTALAETYFQLPAIWKRPNDPFYHRLAEKVRENDIDGILLLRHVFCDFWHSAAYELKKRLSLPVLEIDLDGKAALSTSAVSRIQAFVETLAI